MDVEVVFDAGIAEKAGAYYTPDPADAIDAWEDLIVEAVCEKNIDRARALIRAEVKAASDERLMDALNKVLCTIVDAKDPRYSADIVSYCSRLRLRDGWTSATIAAKYGKSRTIVRADVQACCELFDLPVPEKRDVNEQQSASNHRPINHE
jgi:hypothetical protein